MAKQVVLKRQGLADQVATAVRERILTGEIGEGHQLMQEQLAAEFGVSKVPVREALFQLEAEGFVAQHFHRGAVVVGHSPEEVMEIFELRTEIEVWLLRLAMAKATEKDVKAAKILATAIAKARDPDKSWELNWRFHEALYKPADKPFVIDHLAKLHFKTARYVRAQYAVALSRDGIDVEHRKLIELYETRNQEAVTFLREHILQAATQLTEHLRKIEQQKKA